MSACKLCSHIMPTGRTCKTPAMRGTAFCYYHGPQKRSRPAKAPEAPIELEDFVDSSSIAVNAARVLSALAANRISKARAAVLFQGLNTVLASFRAPGPDAWTPGLDPEIESDPHQPGNPSLAPIQAQLQSLLQQATR